ncbi:hypothetical protein [Chroococcidiopsis sp. CCNUC1]|uniref:hypothetical protein n=1 Tax=Chroococcidiopsis sp. CCNUC1 TaxID=2653189 RepID=UPI0020216D21|nr:hypothetical protein [Chroococcidiopsis sp. CCNUC1]URD50126.1 hypothetical protein M5J74_27980 [Chroococcidiopsis sp. CCNUC1]
MLNIIGFKRYPRIYQAICLGLGFTLIQVLFGCLFSNSQNLVEGYSKLCRWDCDWYTHIIEHGYRSTIPPTPQNPDLSNVAFFPGYPVIAGAIKNVFNLSTQTALLLAAQIACWGFWTYVFLLFQRWRISDRLSLCGAIAILVHPAAFYLVAGYSESLFLMMLLGFLYWTASKKRVAWILAATHGFVMTATRVVGLPIAIYPLFHFWLLSAKDRQAKPFRFWQKSSKYLLVSAVSILGSLLFFAFCYFKFGAWNFYMQTQAIGWGVKPNYLAIFKPESYFAFLDPKILNLPGVINAISVPFALISFFIVFLLERKAAPFLIEGSWKQRAEFYVAGWLMFYLSACGMSSLSMTSMVRYTFCVHVVLVLATIHLISRTQFYRLFNQKWIVFLLLLMATPSLLLQMKFVGMFTNMQWVA